MKDDDWAFPLWIAHRGAGRLAPENTLAAFRQGAAHGYRAFECDVKLSADGVPFLLHDATLERTTGEHGIAGDRTWAELSRIDAGGWHSRAYAGEPLPSLQGIVRYVQRNGFALNVEIKPSPGIEHRTGVAVGEACTRLWQKDCTAPLFFSSFRPEALQGAREGAPAIKRALLVDSLWSGWLEIALSLDCVAVVTNHALMDAALHAQLQDAGLRALCYTVNDPAEARRLVDLGIDGLITDAVDRFSPGTDVAD
ncbi:MAG TPA: glycerophosphodiester phosphodiesterase [Rubrivivax sp.]|nr:glycerophosphodiester phosphodiesterase [Rubrivivax sp.]